MDDRGRIVVACNMSAKMRISDYKRGNIKRIIPGPSRMFGVPLGGGIFVVRGLFSGLGGIFLRAIWFDAGSMPSVLRCDLESEQTLDGKILLFIYFQC